MWWVLGQEIRRTISARHCRSQVLMMRRIGIIGSGPMAGYSLRHLITSETPLAITIFEADEIAGCGMPYRAGMNADEMYCNAFSREIPVYTQRLAHWLKDQPETFLKDWDLAQDDIDSRSFYPRVLLGKYLTAEFEALCEKGRAHGHKITVKCGHCVADIAPDATILHCTGDGKNDIFDMLFDDVIIATGHVWPEHPKIDGVELVSPWPYSNITTLPPTRLGILGSSLSAIDALVALAFEHGEFVETNGQVAWYPATGAECLYITMVSQDGIMPEPDFFYAYPYEALRHITPEAVDQEIAKGTDDLLNRVFDLMVRELQDADPTYFESLGDGADTIEGFCKAYVSHRKELGGLRALRASLQSATQSFEEKVTQAYRYALLRGHENFEPLLDPMNDSDREVFRVHLAPVFGDCYAAIPHISVQRVLALYDAGVVDLVATQEAAAFMAVPEGISIQTIDGEKTFDFVVDARGQAAASVKALPFPTLVQQIDDTEAALLAPYRMSLAPESLARVYCLAMPQILALNPFAQGLANCAVISKSAVDDILADRDLSSGSPRNAVKAA